MLSQSDAGAVVVVAVMTDTVVAVSDYGLVFGLVIIVVVVVATVDCGLAVISAVISSGYYHYQYYHYYYLANHRLVNLVNHASVADPSSEQL